MRSGRASAASEAAGFPAPPSPRTGDADGARAAALALAARLDALAPAALGVAVSGGGDSAALLLACADWRDADPSRRLEACTVDHGLRPEAAQEAEAVAALCARLGVPHRTLRWTAAPCGNLAAAAREGRARLLSAWAAERALSAIALGHTRDDQAETVLMRLARGSGADGLSAMRERSVRGGALWLRPGLSLSRAALRALLRHRRQGWFEDPTNDDLAHDRPRARAALTALAPLGLSAEGLAETAARLADDSDLLRAFARDLTRRIAAIGAAGEIRLDRAAYREAPPQLRRRVLARLLRLIPSAPHPPRHASLAALDEALLAPGPVAPRTLHGCVILADAAFAHLCREPAALPARSAPGAPLDGRWRLPDLPGLAPGPLGAPGLTALKREARAGRWTPPPAWAAAPRPAREAAPALWRVDGTLGAAPLAEYGGASAQDLLAARILR